MNYSVSIVCLLLLFKTILHQGVAVIYILPTEPANTPCPSNQNTCFTLNEWIENGTHPFTNGTTVSLLSGIHFINSTVNFLLIENVSSIIFSGQFHRETTVECNYRSIFGFKFYNVKEVIISNIQIKSCAVLCNTRPDTFLAIINPFKFSLAFIKSQNVMLINMTITNGGVLVEIYDEEGSEFQIYNSMLSCSSFVIQAGHKINIKRTSIQNILYNEHYVLEISSALNVNFTDVTFFNNAVPLRIGSVEYTEFRGFIHFSRNSGDGGIIFYNCVQMSIFPNTTIEFSNNIVRKNLLHIFTNDEYQDTSIIGEFVGGDESKVIAFVDNTAKDGGIMILESTNTLNTMYLSNTHLIFKNNYCVNSNNNYAAVLLMIHASLILEHSNATFSHNRSPLSGGITLISSSLSTENSNIHFKRNEGTDGGGIAMYDRSQISCTNICNFYFDHNMATRRGGATFVEDSDNIKIYTQASEYHHSFAPSLGKFILNFSSNKALLAGDDIYGGWIDSKSAGIYSPLIIYFQDNSSNTVTSNPTRICMCSNSIPLCNITEHQLNVFPGQTFHIEAVAVGQRMGIVPSTVNILESPNEGSLSAGQDVQSVGRNCTTVQFTLNTLRRDYKLKLRSQGSDIFESMASKLLKKKLSPRFHILFQQFNIMITFKNCPLGYEVSQSSKKCLCSNQHNRFPQWSGL